MHLTLSDRFATALSALLPDPAPALIGVAVSGGGDSMALLALACDWARANGARVEALTVDHGLREDSAAEAAWVSQRAAQLGAAHQTLRWQGWDGQGNLQAAARAARYALLAGWAEAAKAPPPVILLGHTHDDQAETFLMRLARGSGVEGLTAMPAQFVAPGGTVHFLRPLLGEHRAALRAHLTAQGLDWLEDPSNEDPRFDRVRMRAAMEDLSGLGLTPDRLARTAAHMGRAAEALRARAADVAREVVEEVLPGVLLFDKAGLAATERDTQLRLLAHALQCVSSSPYRPRLIALETALDGALAGRGSTLHGGQIIVTPTHIVVVREARAVAEMEGPADGAYLWDNRWRVRGARLAGCTLRALGEAGASKIDRPEALPHAALVSYPGVFNGETPVAAPDLWHSALCTAVYAPRARFHQTILSH